MPNSFGHPVNVEKEERNSKTVLCAVNVIARTLVCDIHCLPVLEGGPCHNCGSTKTNRAAWAFDGDGNVYCHSRPCLRAGGWLPPKGRKRKTSAQNLPGVPASLPGLPSNVNLLLCEEILGQRYVDPSTMSAEALRNTVPTEDEHVQWLVSGKFGTGIADRGFYTVAWLELEEMLEAEGKPLKASVKKGLGDYQTALKEEVAKAVKRCR